MTSRTFDPPRTDIVNSERYVITISCLFADGIDIFLMILRVKSEEEDVGSYWMTLTKGEDTVI
jgi:hypothetical protein